MQIDDTKVNIAHQHAGKREHTLALLRAEQEETRQLSPHNKNIWCLFSSEQSTDSFRCETWYDTNGF